MPRNKDLPKAQPRICTKDAILKMIKEIDDSPERRRRVLTLESSLLSSIDTHLSSLNTTNTTFSKLNTSPFVLLFYCKKMGYSNVSQIEKDIIPAKVFSSMETAAGNIVQQIVMPFYGWTVVESEMHSKNSVIDIKSKTDSKLKLVTLKSGPRCLNDEMSKDIAEDIVANAKTWSDEEGVDHIEFVYGVLYGTEVTSNKKDWHILRNVSEMKGQRFMKELPAGKWMCSFENRGTLAEISVKIGSDLWDYIGDKYTLLEVTCALIRASVLPAGQLDTGKKFSITDLEKIISLEDIPKTYNISLLQRSQLEWLFFVIRHFYDDIV